MTPESRGAEVVKVKQLILTLVVIGISIIAFGSVITICATFLIDWLFQ